MVEANPSLLRSASTAAAQGMVFQAAQGLLGDTTLGLGAYITPLLLAQSPWTVGVTAARNGGVIVMLFGETVRGQSGVASELLQLFHPDDGRIREAPQPLPATHVEDALTWWTQQLDSLFTEATDPCNYRRNGTDFDVRRQLQTLLSLEQAFRNVQSILSSDRDAHAGRVACFDTLDTIEGLSVGLNFFDMTKARIAERTVEEMRAVMPSGVQDLLLPKAEAAVSALKSLQDGFFDSPSRTAGGLMLPDKKGGLVDTSLELATAEYLRLLRNAGHSFGGRAGHASAREDVLLMSHDGRITSAINGLAYLYLLRLVAQPERLRRHFGGH